MADTTSWWSVVGPFNFTMTTTGDLTVEFGLPIPNAEPTRAGFVVPAKEAQKLLKNLSVALSLQETLSVEPSRHGAN